ncbi:hypothetical protein QUF76_02545 [Desulfobacterales bacterium HSG16]|nr:hypothetical protein [Desulfobacterales bacterium HSG16]
MFLKRIVICCVYLLFFGVAFNVGIKIEASEITPKKLILATTMKNANSALMLYHVLVYREAGKRLGIDINIVAYPSKRATYLGDVGEVDGQSGRVYNYNNKHPNLTIVEESIISVYFTAYALDTNIELNGWKSLKGTPFKVDYRRGTNLCKIKLPNVLPHDRITAIDEIKLGFRKILMGRTDIIVGIDDYISEELEQAEFKSSGIHKVGVMEEVTVHPFLHLKHKVLASKLSNVLSEMKKEGLMKYYLSFARSSYQICKESKVQNDSINCWLK